MGGQKSVGFIHRKHYSLYERRFTSYEHGFVIPTRMAKGTVCPIRSSECATEHGRQRVRPRRAVCIYDQSPARWVYDQSSVRWVYDQSSVRCASAISLQCVGLGLRSVFRRIQWSNANSRFLAPPPPTAYEGKDRAGKRRRNATQRTISASKSSSPARSSMLNTRNSFSILPSLLTTVRILGVFYNQRGDTLQWCCSRTHM